LIAGRKPVGIINDNALPSDREHAVHNTMMCYAYVAALAARNKQALSLLDWGGGLGLYYPLTKNVVPDVKIDYHCKELRLLCEKGRLLFPDAHFYDEDNECFARTYDLVLISASLQYAEDWKSAVSQLAGASRSYVYVTRLPIVHKAPSFVVVQRPYQYGYQTEYLGWFLNRQEFLDHMNSLNLELMREFLINERPAVPNAPEQAEYRGFLYRRTT
jgi:putative methyltransferase (TIGR04325 family)